MLFNPDVEAILRRPKIEKPQEEFILENPPAQFPEEVTQEELLVNIEQRPLVFIEELNQEAATVQELIDALIETAEDITVDVPQEDKELLGEKINTQDYIRALTDLEDGREEHKAHRIVEHFEWGILGDTNADNTSWTLLALRDFRQSRRDLVNAIGILEGTLLGSTSITTGGIDWSRDAIDSHISRVYKGVIKNSVGFRVKFFNTVRSINVDLKTPIFEGLIAPITRAQEVRLRRVLLDLEKALRSIKVLLHTAHLIRNLEYLQVRTALASILKEEVTKHLISTFVALTNRVRNRVIDPVISIFLNGFEDSGPLAMIGDQLSEQFASIVADTIDILLKQYTDLSAELLRELEKESQTKILKLQVLGERSVISRYISHIDKALTLIDKTLKELNLSQEVANRLFGNITQKQAAPQNRLIQRLEEREDYQGISTQPFKVRSVMPNVENISGPFSPGEIPSVDQIAPVEPPRRNTP